MHKKVLIFFPRPLLKNHGGAYTYLFHLKNALKGKEHSITFLSDLIPIKEENSKEENQHPLRSLKQLLPVKMLNSVRILKYLTYINSTRVDETINKIDLSKYQLIHVHETVDIYRFQHLFKNYKGKILLTPHTPKP
ncbi:MAG TPA: hypothetical protein VM888_13390, partial [Chitinophagaceae bacterium]|nr:hypothetical protein [Chitinophagaceae bacterium]